MSRPTAPFLKCLPLAAMFIFASTTLESTAADAPISTTICDILAAPARFHNSLVKFGASVESDGTHFTRLIDRACPRRGFTPMCPVTNPDCAGIEMIREAVYRKGHPGTIDKEVSATFTGTIEIRANGIPKRVIYIDDVSGLVSIMKPE